MKKRILSALLVTLLLVTMVPVTAFAKNPRDEISVQAEEIATTGTSSVGVLLSKALTEEQQERSEDLEHITDLEIEGNVATVSYQVLDEDCAVVVALYDDLHPEVMLTSGTAEISDDETQVKVEIAGTMPAHYLATAYLIDTQTHAPRCPAFTSQLYTQEMQAFLSTTVADYDADLVLNLDEDDTTNFAVFSEGTAQLAASGSKNQLTDNDDGTYTITNADRSVTTLKVGDVFAYPITQTNEMLLVKVKAISVKGSTVTITEDENVALEDFFDYLKVESNGNSGEMTVDTSAADEGVTCVEEPQQKRSSQKSIVDEEAKLNFSAGFKLDKTLVGDEDTNVKLTGNVGLDFGIALKCYIDLDYQYISLKLDNKLNFSVGLSGKVTMAEIPLGRIEVAVLPCINVGFTPAFVVKVSGKIECKGSVKTTIGFAYDSEVGFVNLSAWPKLEANVDFSGTLFVGIQAKPYVAFVSADLCKATVTCSAGVELEGKENIWQSSESVQHDCQFCIAGTVKTKLEVTADVDIVKGWLKKEAKIAATDKKYGDFYCSLDYHEFGWSTCPHIRYKTTVTVKDENGDPAANVKISGTGLSTAPTTNSNGKAAFYLPNGKYILSVAYGGMTTRKTITVQGEGKSVTITLGESDDGAGGGGGWGGEPIMQNLIASGDCGEDVKWKLDSSGLLYIYGTGEMENYQNGLDYAPWYSYYDIIKKVRIDSGVTTIGNSAFVDCYRLTNVAIPNSITIIGGGAFLGSGLTAVTIPDSVTTIGNEAFSWCECLTSVDISDNVVSIGDGVFSKCTSLMSVVIPSGVTAISDDAFAGCSSLTSVTIPDSVTTIGFCAFKDCGLTSVTIPNSVTSIGRDAFCNCLNLTSVTIPDGVEYIGYYAFSYCDSLTSVTIPDSVTDIGRYAFYGCDKLISAGPIGSGCNIEFGWTTRIPAYAFCECTSLTSVTIPGSVVWGGIGMFSGCSKLVSAGPIGSGCNIEFGWTTKTPTNAFSGCANLASITFPNGVEHIASYAFDGCTSLTSITIPDSVISIGNYVFSGCTNLSSITIPDSVLSIFDHAFNDCVSLTDVYYTGTQAQWEAISIFSDNDPLTNATIHYRAAANAVAPVVKVPEIPREWDRGDPLGTLMPPVETTEGDTLFTSRFDGLNAGMDYVLLVVKDWAATDLLAPENLLYIAQGTAAADGTLSFTYMLSGTESAWPIAGGWLMGDVNGDDRVDGKDIVTLARHIAKIERITDANKRKLADVNGDTVVNAADLTALTKIIQKNKT